MIDGRHVEHSGRRVERGAGLDHDSSSRTSRARRRGGTSSLTGPVKATRRSPSLPFGHSSSLDGSLLMRGHLCRSRQFPGTMIRHGALIPSPSRSLRLSVVDAPLGRLPQPPPRGGRARPSPQLPALGPAVDPGEVTWSADAEGRPASSTHTHSNLHPAERPRSRQRASSSPSSSRDEAAPPAGRSGGTQAARLFLSSPSVEQLGGHRHFATTTGPPSLRSLRRVTLDRNSDPGPR